MIFWEFFSSFFVWVFPLILIVLIFIGRCVGYIKSDKEENIYALMVLAYVSVFAALRYETGDDWEGYRLYFDSITLSNGIIDEYLSSPLLLQFEPGYYVLSYVVKIFGGTYSFVNFISVFAFFCALICSISRFELRALFVVSIFVGMPLISLYYNQVRQCLALSFFLLALSSKGNIKATLFGLLTLFFQYSTIPFVASLLFVKLWPTKSYNLFKILVIAAPVFLFLTWANYFGGYDLLRILTPESLAFKVSIYQEEETDFGIFRIVAIFVLTMIAIFIFKKFRKIAFGPGYLSLPIELSLIGCLQVLYASILFPNSYAFFGRALVFSLIVLAFAFAILINHYGVTTKYGTVDFWFAGLCLLSTMYYFATLIFYTDVYIPYRFVLSD